MSQKSESYCTGCHTQFQTAQGLLSHLHQCQNDEHCLAVYQEYMKSFLPTSESDSDFELDPESDPGEEEPEQDEYSMDVDDVDPMSLDPMDVNSVPFEEPGQPFDPNNKPAHENTTAVEEEVTWEPEREGLPVEVADNKLEEDNGSDSDDEHYLPTIHQATDHRHQAERVLIDTGDGPKACVTIRYTKKHPHSWAGSILTHSASHDDAYTSTLADYDRNAWAPFNSKLDWELARWAKMRGPGSTALSELLAIEGVRIPLILIDS